jgi:uncharacterized protein (DUF924 family)
MAYRMPAKSTSKAQNPDFDFKPVLDFWYGELSESDRWSMGKLLDPAITERFSAVHKAAAAGELWQWREAPEGRLAEIIVLDQFSRHIFRNTPAAFACDPIALVLAQESVRAAADHAVDERKREFMYMPYMHSESAKIHVTACELFASVGDMLKYEIDHRKVIERFGRYPHRNAILGRISPPEEIEFLKTAGSSFQ